MPVSHQRPVKPPFFLFAIFAFIGGLTSLFHVAAYSADARKT
jgi:hypothetical protein